MKVKITSWRGPQVVSLESALTPDAWSDGSVENAAALARAACEATGRLLAHFVIEGTLTLADARTIAGLHEDAELVPERTRSPIGDGSS